MLNSLALPFIASFFALAGAISPLGARDMRLHERREVIPRGFVKTTAAPASQMLNLRLALVQSDPQGLEDALYAVSTPSSALYGQFLTKEEVMFFRSSLCSIYS